MAYFSKLKVSNEIHISCKIFLTCVLQLHAIYAVLG